MAITMNTGVFQEQRMLWLCQSRLAYFVYSVLF